MEFEDKNVKKAVQKAAKALKVPAEALKYEVLSYGSTGIFGLVGAKKAKIRVQTNGTEKSEAPKRAKVQDRREGPPKKAPDRPPAEKAAPRRPVKPRVEKEPPPAAPAAPTPVQTPQPSREMDQEDIDRGRRVLEKILDKITEGASVRIEEQAEQVVFHVDGGKAAVLIGKRGQTLEAIQYLVDRVVNKNGEARIRLQIDVAGYLDSKRVNLEQRAVRLAEKAKKIGKPVTVGELNVYDRKIVHVSLKEDNDVRTQSMGSGFYRKLVIFPKKGGAPKKNQDGDESNEP